jgi:2'-5' RNA ligase
MVRCFIGFVLPQNIKKHVDEIQKEIVSWPIMCKFVEVENLHVCMSFLGEVDEKEIDCIGKKLDEICKIYPKFEAVVNGVKAIPNESYIRVLALDVSDSKGIMESIRKEVVEKIGGDSHPPHLTLCRVKNVSDKKSVVQKLEEMKSVGEIFHVAGMQLIKSELSRSGPVYSVIHESMLAG